MTIALQPEQHRDLIAALTRAAEAIDAELDSLDAAAAGLRSQWSGAARAAYDHAHQEWTTSMAALRRLLHSAGIAASDVADVLSDANHDAAALWN